MRRRSRGQALVEFALVVPIILVMAIATFDMGRVVWAMDSVSNAAREGSRLAVVSASVAGVKENVRQRVRDTAVGAAGSTGLVINVCYGKDCVGDTDTSGATPTRGEVVTVRVRSEMVLVTTALLGQRNFPVTGSSTMVVSN